MAPMGHPEIVVREILAMIPVGSAPLKLCIQKMRDALNVSSAVWLQDFQCGRRIATIAPSEHGACCIFATKSARKPWKTVEHSQPGSYH